MKKRSPIFLLLLVLPSFFLFPACGDTTNYNYNGGPDEGPRITADDLDGDGLSNDEEALTGSSPLLSDTDGDGMSDFDEIRGYGFDPAVNPYKFNPLAADVPRLGIVLKSPPSVKINFTLVDGETRAFEVERLQANRVAVTQKETDRDTQVIEMSQNTNNTSAPSDGQATDVRLSFDIGKTVTDEVTFEFTKEQFVENEQAVTEIERFEQTHVIAADSGALTVVVELENKGDIAFRIESLILSVVMPDPSQPGMFMPVANLVLDTSHQYGHYPPASLPPGGKFPAIHFAGDLDVITAKYLLKESRSLIVTVASVELTDADGRPLAFNYTEINARTAAIVIDYAGLRRLEKYSVATNADPDNPGVTAGQALQDILHIPFEAGAMDWRGQPKTGLLGLRYDAAIRADEHRNSYWLVVHTRKNGLGNIVTRHSLLDRDYDFENIRLRAGDTLYLVYMEDKDNDGVFSRQEFLLGTDDLQADSDSDGLSDFSEINVSYTHPSNPDTDGDGAIDSSDSSPLDPGTL